MKYRIVEVRADGTGYAKFYFDDSTSAGQMLHGMPVDDQAKFHDALVAMASEVESRSKPVSPRVVAPAVRDLVGKEIVLEKAPLLETLL